MAQCETKREIEIMTEDKAGALAEVTAAVVEAGANIEALCAYGMQGKATFLLITNDNSKVMQAATVKGWEVEEHDVIVVTLDDKVGTANEAAEKLKQKGISLYYCYATTGGADTCKIVMRGPDSDAIVSSFAD